MSNRLKCTTLLFALFVCACPRALPQTCVTAPQGLVSWWTGDANQNDIIGGNNPAAVNAVTLVPAEALDGFTFGTGGYIYIAPAADLANQQFTWMAWVMPNGPGPNNDAYGSIIVVQDTDDSNDVVSLDWRANPDYRFVFGFGNITNEIIYSTDVFPPGAFYLVAATYDGTTFRLYVNGVLEGTQTETKTIPYSTQDWVIGAADPYIAGQGYPRTWNGIIDEVQAYNVALSQSQIQSIYSAGHAGVCKGLTFSPTSLKFPRQTIGTSSPPKTVTATNSFPLPVTVRKVATSGDFTQTNTCPKTLATGAACTASVTFAPSATGTRSGKLTFTDTAPVNPQRVSLTGSATDISLSASRLNFGRHKVGTTSGAQSVTVTNEGTVTVNFTGSGIVIAGTDPADFLISADTCGPSLAAGATCTVSVEFDPTAAGARSAQLQFNDDGGGSPQAVTLTGTGA
ncbi:MAG TPA: choice-of-anchor D domain-containing protein [Bryobacteraceae bacterium]|nr:choice-of-anchor D domain-containing protein [Bryobacteraceae bacterium]